MKHASSHKLITATVLLLTQMLLSKEQSNYTLTIGIKTKNFIRHYNKPHRKTHSWHHRNQKHEIANEILSKCLSQLTDSYDGIDWKLTQGLFKGEGCGQASSGVYKIHFWPIRAGVFLLGRHPWSAFEFSRQWLHWAKFGFVLTQTGGWSKPWCQRGEAEHTSYRSGVCSLQWCDYTSHGPQTSSTKHYCNLSYAFAHTSFCLFLHHFIIGGCRDFNNSNIFCICLSYSRWIPLWTTSIWSGESLCKIKLTTNKRSVKTKADFCHFKKAPIWKAMRQITVSTTTIL